MTAPALAEGHYVIAVAPALVDGVGVDGCGRDAGALAFILQRLSLRQSVFCPAVGVRCLAAPRQRPVSPIVGLGQVAAPISCQLFGQFLRLGGVGCGVIFRAPVGFKVLYIVLVAGDDLGELVIAPPSIEPFGGLFDKNPITLLLFILCGDVLQGDPSSGDRGNRDSRQCQVQNYELEDTSQVGHEEIFTTEWDF